MNTATATLTSALQDTFHRIETLGSGNFGGNGKAVAVPSAPSSRVTDSVFGNPMHDIHKIRVPQAIPENSVLSSSNAANANANSNPSNGTRRRYVIGIIVIVFLLLGIFGAIFFIRRRNNKRLQEEYELAALAEEQFKKQVLEHQLHANKPQQAQAIPIQSHPVSPVQPQPDPATPSILAQQRQEQARIRAQAEEQEQIQAQEQARARALLRAQAQEQARIREEAQTAEKAKLQAQVQAQAQAQAQEASQKQKLQQPVRAEVSVSEGVRMTETTDATDNADNAADDMEALVSKKLDTRKRLETLRQQLENGITNAVHNVSDSVAKSIAAQRAFSAHSVDQEYDENVLLETGKPLAAPALQDKELPSISLLDVPIAAHPDNSVPVGSN